MPHNTGNPLGSEDPRDLIDNAEVVDRLANGLEPVFDRFGIERIPLKRLEQDYPHAGVDADRAEAALGEAVQAKDLAFESALQGSAQAVRAEAAAEAALFAEGIYGSPSAGSSAVENGRGFVVPSAQDQGAFDVYLKTGGAPIGPLSTTPSTNYVKATRAPFAEDMYQIEPGALVPLIATETGAGVQANVWYAAQDGELVVNGQVAQTSKTLADPFFGMYRSSQGSILPLVATRDEVGNIRANVWYDADLERLLINGVAAGSVAGALSYAPPEPVAAPLRAANANVQHVMTYGQSLSKGVQSEPVFSLTQPYNNLTFSAGPRATLAGSVGLNPGMGALVPLVENTAANDSVVISIGETPCSGWANGLTKRLAQAGEDWRTGSRQFLGTANGRNSASITQLLPGGSTAEGNWFQVLRDAISQGKALSAAAGKSYSMPSWVYMQGEGDNADAAMSGGVYRGHLSNLHAAVTSYYQAATGNADIPWLGVYQTYARTRRVRPHATIDQLEYCETGVGVYHLTALYHIALAHDGHLSTLGSYWVGQYAAKKTKQILDGYRPAWMRLGGATLKGKTITYRPREIPVAPLRILTDAHLRACEDKGFYVQDAGGKCAIESIAIGADGRSVVIDLVSVPSGAVKLRYGLDYLPAGQVNYADSAGGNLVDSDPDNFEFSGAVYPLYNVCPHFEINVIPV